MFQTVALSEITVHREDRQRRTLTDIEDLADSIARLGLINPITLDDNNILIAGERRLAACRSLGWTHVPARYFSELSEIERHLIELEENIKRKDISWQEHTQAIAKYHALKQQENPDWSERKTADAIGMSFQNINKHLTVARELSSPLVNTSATFTTAVERAQTVARRRDDIHNIAPCDYTHSPIIHGDFIKWSAQAQDPKFNFIHCDFPYGIDAQASGRNPSAYNDSPEIYLHLFKALTVNLDNFCAPDAHMIFWFAASQYCQTWEMLKLLDGFKFDETPLIWHKSDSKGIVPDPYRRPRRVYEMAFFGWRGNAKINAVRENLFSAVTERERHPHEKSQAMLEHFFSMFADKHTRLLDPTCGSGSSLRAGKALGANILGIELDEGFADVARRTLLEGNVGTTASNN